MNKILVFLLGLFVGCGGSASVDSNQSSNQSQDTDQDELVCNECLGFDSRESKLECLDLFDCEDDFLEAIEEE